MPSEQTGDSRPSRRASGRHRAPQGPSSTARLLRTTGAVTALVGGGLAVTAAPAHAATPEDFAKLRQCESGGNYAINTGNGYYGAYQFDKRTWQGLGYSGLPHEAAPAVQDEAAYRLYNSRGWSPWPACARKLGLTNNGQIGVSSSGAAGNLQQEPVKPAMTLDKAQQEIQQAGFGGTISTADGGEVRADAYVWQHEMREQRFALTVDGKFGPQSQGVAALYSYLTKVSDGQPGVVGENLWKATVES
ncbi:transglycosylase family protein [Frankia sp. CNm7]|uniref:Transglycosylase family protein n=1 Tax=Frankia nepalensis TaxID=1836974 RepID=A0A937RGF9_9ACTN|nr:transglycosylase family protein [Frankia nepalensis]MBL7501350.1 transglycosylase family protein [Frankia nepalensis]MBL7509863.1 transglycosylase family protein [Frankia nepalensis]MBL7520698.1 transglycosylase family protein [Frankia nepalensis]MBL7629622.1 transglycosylase family protein [Frankia nepalensis]